MTYLIETRRTVAGKRYYIRLDGKLMRGGFARLPAAAACVRTLQVMDQERAQLREQIQTLRQERTQ